MPSVFREFISKHETVVDIDPLETMEMEEEESRLIDRYNDLQLDRNEEIFVAGRDAMGKPLRGSPGVDPFSNYADKMTNVRSDGKVKKQVIKNVNYLRFIILLTNDIHLSDSCHNLRNYSM